MPHSDDEDRIELKNMSKRINEAYIKLKRDLIIARDGFKAPKDTLNPSHQQNDNYYQQY